MELPECPVCLETYDGHRSIPRVLLCGHTVCQLCLINIPRKFPDTIRCPACTVLVNYPPQAPFSLPKNIDLLRLIPSSSLHQNSPKPIKIHQQTSNFLPLSWSNELYSAWKDRILDNDVVSVVDGEQTTDCSLLLVSGWLREKQKVSLLRVGSLLIDDDSMVFKLSYVARVLSCVSGMREEFRNELGSVLSVKQSRVCKILGLWGDLETGVLYLVCEQLNGCVFNDFSKLSEDNLSCFRMIGVEICESFIGLHREGMIAGCLSFSCLRFDEFGHVYIDLNEVLVAGRKVSEIIVKFTWNRIGFSELGVMLIELLENEILISPKVLLELLQKKGIDVEEDVLLYSAGFSSDVWLVCCILYRLLIGKEFIGELVDTINRIVAKGSEDDCLSSVCSSKGMMDRAGLLSETKVAEVFNSVVNILHACLNVDPANSPNLTDVWKCIRELVIRPQFDAMATLTGTTYVERVNPCLVLGVLCLLRQDELQQKEDNGEIVLDSAKETTADKSLVKGLQEGSVNSIDMKGHLDCVTGLAVGGGFLFSSSFDKTVHAWSLQDFSHLHTFKGHEHKVMAVAYVDGDEPLFVSGDSGGGIFIWSACIPFEKEPLKKWYEPKDWRYTGIHALTTSGNEYLYTGSGDKTIKAWSLEDGTLVCTMSGHKSVVSALTISNGVLHSGSWDGTIRLWSLSDHSLLTVLGEETPNLTTAVLSLSADHHSLVAAHENGSLKIWRNDVFMKSIEVHDGAILTVGMEGNWLFTAGWDKTVCVQELAGDEFQIEARSIGSIPCDSVITSLLYWQGKLFVGFGNRNMRVYYCGK